MVGDTTRTPEIIRNGVLRKNRRATVFFGVPCGERQSFYNISLTIRRGKHIRVLPYSQGSSILLKSTLESHHQVWHNQLRT